MGRDPSQEILGGLMGLLIGSLLILSINHFRPSDPLPTPVEHRTQSIFEPDTEIPVYIHVRATAYCACPICCGRWSGGPTASGVMPQEGRTIAADTATFGFGTCLVLPTGVHIVEDTGSAIKGWRIDIFFKSHDEALGFGVRDIFAQPC
jgi:3D (Asp-Asp-Asp) domain-containing protein